MWLEYENLSANCGQEMICLERPLHCQRCKKKADKLFVKSKIGKKGLFFCSSCLEKEEQNGNQEVLNIGDFHLFEKGCYRYSYRGHTLYEKKPLTKKREKLLMQEIDQLHEQSGGGREGF